MLKIISQDRDFIHYRLNGKLDGADIDRLFAMINPVYRRYGKVRLLAEARHFGGYADWWAIGRLLRHEPTLLWKVNRYALVSHQAWLKGLFRIGSVLAPWMNIGVYKRLGEARQWLQQDLN